MPPRSEEEMRRRLVEKIYGGKMKVGSSGSASARASGSGSQSRPQPFEVVGQTGGSDVAVEVKLDSLKRRADKEPTGSRPSKKQNEAVSSSAIQPKLCSFLAESVSCDPSRFAMKTDQEKIWEVVGVLNNFVIPALSRLFDAPPPWTSGPSSMTAQLEAKVAKVSKEAEKVLRDFKELQEGYNSLAADNDLLKKRVDKLTKQRDNYKERLSEVANYAIGLKDQFDGHVERAVRKFMDSEYLTDVIIDVAAGQVRTGWNCCRKEVRRRLADETVTMKEPPAAGFTEADDDAWSDPAPAPLTFEWPEPIPIFGSQERPCLPELDWNGVRKAANLPIEPKPSVGNDEKEEEDDGAKRRA